MKNICILSLILLLFSSCDFTANYCFIIINNTNNDLVIKTSTKTYDNGFYFSDSIHIVESGEKIKFVQDLGICGKKFIPDDIYLIEDTIPKASKLDIYVDGKIQKKLRLRAYWIYENRLREGIYTLYVIPEYLEK